MFLTTPIRPSLERLQDAKKKKDPKEPAATQAWLNVFARGAQILFLLLKRHQEPAESSDGIPAGYAGALGLYLCLQ